MAGKLRISKRQRTWLALLCFAAVPFGGCVGTDNPSDAGRPDPAPNPDAEPRPIMLVHGKPVSVPGASGPSYDYSPWATAQEAWRTWGLGEQIPWMYYADDVETTFDVHDHPSGVEAQGHDLHHGGPLAHAAGGRHDGDTPIEHLAFHWAWAVHDRYASSGLCVDAVANSMGGLIVRYAIGAYSQRAEPGFAEFPPSLCVSNVATLGTPHAGTRVTRGCAPTDRQCSEVSDGSSFMGTLAGTAAFRRPEADNGTRWIVFGSDMENVVAPPESTYMMEFDRAIMHEREDLVFHAEEKVPGTSVIVPTNWYLSNGGTDATAHVRNADRGGPWQSSAAAEWPARAIHRFFTEAAG